MALIECPECGHEVSSAATACPNCGHPFRQEAATGRYASNASGTLTASLGRVRVLSFGLSGTVAGFWWAVAALYVLAALAFLGAWGTWTGFTDGAAGLDEMSNADSVAFEVGWVALLGTWISGVLFIIWFFQAYQSAESRGASGRTWGAGWTVGSWFIPFANLVIPKLVLNEVDRMSNPLAAGDVPIDDRWKRLPRMVSSDLWYVSWLVAIAAYWIGTFAYYSAPTFAGSGTGKGYLVLSLSNAVFAAAAALIGFVVFVIGKRLRYPPAEMGRDTEDSI